jgi:carbon storage regulator
MLVLTRKLNEKVYIGNDITICVVAIDRNKVRLGIEAPRDLPIYREELLSLAASSAPTTPVYDVGR